MEASFKGGMRNLFHYITNRVGVQRHGGIFLIFLKKGIDKAKGMCYNTNRREENGSRWIACRALRIRHTKKIRKSFENPLDKDSKM